ISNGISNGLAEGVFLGSPSVGRTQTSGRAPADRTGDETDAILLHKLCVTGSRTKLLTNGKVGIITGLCSKKASKIFSGTSYRNFLNEIPRNTSQGASVAETQEELWMLFTDGSSCVDGSGAGLILTNPDGVEFTYALSKNKKVDALSKIASTSFAHLSKQVLVEVLETKSITGKEVTAIIEEEGPTWMMELVNYLKEGTLPEDEKEARKIRLKARQYELMKGILYKRSFLTPWLRCVGPLQAEYVMKEIHEGAVTVRYTVTRHPQQPLTLIMALWSFYKWGIDIAGPIPEGPGKVKFLIVAMDYFTKWIEAKAVNGLVERANRSLGEGIKAHLGEGNKNWVEELPHVLWAHRTMVKSSHDDTPFSLTYGTEAVVPAEIGMPTYRTTVVDVVNNDEELRLNLDFLEERRELAAINKSRSKSKMTKYYNSRVRGVAFQPGDFVYRSNDASHAAAGGKLGPKWEGPYEVTDALGNGAYKLRSMDGTMLPRT
nr:hypothetical protein [Tanacetum cinerariifolium]